MSEQKFPDAFVRANNARILSSCEVITGSRLRDANETTVSIKNDNDNVQAEATAFLWDVHNRPYVMTTERFKTIDVGGRKLSAGSGTRLLKSLVSKNLLRIHNINLGGRGGSAKFLELTDRGYEVLSLQPKKGIGKGAGFEHGFWQYCQAEEIKSIAGVEKVTIEGILQGKSIDVLVETTNEYVAIEIAMTPDHEKANIDRDLEAGCSKVFIGCKDKTIENAVKNAIELLSDETKRNVTVGSVQKLHSELCTYLHSQGAGNVQR